MRRTLSTLHATLGQPSPLGQLTQLSTGTSDGCVFHCWEDVEKECTIVESSSHQDKDLHSQSHFKNEDLQKVFAYQEMYKKNN